MKRGLASRYAFFLPPLFDLVVPTNVGCANVVWGGILGFSAFGFFFSRLLFIFIQVFVVDTATLAFRELRDRNVDIILARIPYSLDDPDVNIDSFLDDPHIVAAGATHPLTKRKKVTFDDLARQSWVFQRGQVMRNVIQGAFFAHGLSMPREHVITDTVHIRNHLVSTGRYLTITAASILKYSAKQWSLKGLPIELGTKPLPHAIVTLKNRTPNPVSELFIRELKVAARTM